MQQNEKDRLLSEHATEMGQLKDTLNAQKDKQVSSMKARLEERRVIKEKKMEEKKKAELQRIAELEQQVGVYLL